MSKKVFKSQASSSKAVFGSSVAFGSVHFGRAPGSVLSYVYEPPDLGGISDPAVVVCFKNVQKRDSTTRTKALEELQIYVNTRSDSKDALEDSFLEAWARLFPRTSIDNARRVRQLVHTIHGLIIEVCGKRFVKHMPATVGAWLAGLQDGDRPVARSAQDAIKRVFSTEGKQQGVWKAFRDPILEYCSAAALNESPNTLSDNRTVSPDDAEAKYSRAIGGALLTIATLLEVLPVEDTEKRGDSYEELLHSEAVLGLASSEDAFLRKAIYRLITTAEAKVQNLLQLSIVGNHIIKALDTDQTGSMSDFLRCLISLSKAQPEVWTSLYTGSSKKSPHKRLCHFLRKGSQGGSGEVWSQIGILLELVPRSVLLPDTELHPEKDAQAQQRVHVLTALKEGATRKNEIRALQKDAWECYLKLAEMILNYQVEPSARSELIRSSVLPLLQQYINPETENIEWGIGGLASEYVVEKAITVAFSYDPRTIQDVVNKLSDTLIEELKTSLPEQSKDHSKSQDATSDKFKRWYTVRASMLHKGDIQLSEIFTKRVESEVVAATSVLVSRNGKPYSAAMVLERAATLVCGSQQAVNGMYKTGEFQQPVLDKLVRFAKEELPSLMGSLSSLYMLKILQTLESACPLEGTLTAAVQRLAAAEPSPSRDSALYYLTSLRPWPGQQQVQAILSQAVLADLKHALDGVEGKWSLIEATIRNSQSPDSVKEDILAKMTESLSISAETVPALDGFDGIAKDAGQAFARLLASPHAPDLLSKLLFLSQEGDEYTRSRASKLKDIVSSSLAKSSANEITSNPVLNIIKESIPNTHQEALSVESLVSQALDLLKGKPSDQVKDILSELLPEAKQWKDFLGLFLKKQIDDALVLTNPLGGAIHLLSYPYQASDLGPIGYDAQGCSALIRMALFVAKVFKDSDLWEKADSETLLRTYVNISIVAQLANDHLSLPPAQALFDIAVGIEESQTVDAVAEIQSFCADCLRVGAISTEPWLDAALFELYQATGTSQSISYYNARAYAAAASELRELQKGAQKIMSADAELSRMGKQPKLLSDITLLASASSSPALIKLLNELVADIAGRDLEGDLQISLQKIVMLNMVLQVEGMPLEELPKHRLVFFVQHVSAALHSSIDGNIKSELMKILATFLPLIQDIFGEFWENILNAIPQALGSEDSKLPLVHASLRLCSVLLKLVTSHANEDFQESWVDAKPRIAANLLSMLRAHADASDISNQPLKIVNSLLARQVSAFADTMQLELEDMYPIMASESTTLQRSAFEILHKAIPLAQEQVSLEAALSKNFVAKLPEELLSLMLEAPSADNYLDLHRESELPSPLARYLLSWKLVFDHWNNASYTLQSLYVSSLKDSQSLPLLLSFTFNVLIGSQDKHPFDPSRLPSWIGSYSPSPSVDPATESRHLLCHLYYLTLKHAPHLAKDWHTNACPRALKSRVESWTERHVSPLIIAAELATVSAWTPPEVTTAADSSASSKMEIKVSNRAREASASLPLDDTHISIRILLPPAYPLYPIALATGNRVGIDERKWTSFLNVSRIVMNFSSSSQGLGCVIDGIAAWRSNVLSALRGQSECAICYSVVSEDRKVPDKRCATCNNRFHGMCLYKWFQRSGGSSCPLCRNAFNYA